MKQNLSPGRGLSHAPDEKSVEVEIRPLLRFPPSMLFTLIRVFLSGCDSRDGLGDGIEENGAPSDVVIALSQERGEFKLQNKANS